jgi:WD40 repeat protein
VAVHDARSGAVDGPQFQTGARVDALAVSPRGDLLAVANAERGVRLYDARDGSAVELAGAEGLQPTLGLTFSSDGRWLLAGAGSLWIWDMEDRRRPPLTARATDIVAVAAGPAGSWVAAARENGAVVLWPLPTGAADTVGDARTLAAARTLPGRSETATQLATSADGSLLVHLARGGTLRSWRMPAGELLGRVQLDTPLERRLAIVGSGESTRIVLVDLTGAVEVRDAVSGAVVGVDAAIGAAADRRR